MIFLLFENLFWEKGIMLDYNQIINQLKEDRGTIILNAQKTQAITFALIGAIGLDQTVTALKQKKEDFSNIDLSEHIDLFKKANKSVSELEKELALIQKNDKYIQRRFNENNIKIKQLHIMSPNSFFSEYMKVDGDLLRQAAEKGFIQELMTLMKQKNIEGSIVGLGMEAFIFFKNEKHKNYIIDFFSKKNLLIDTTSHRYKRTENNENYLCLLYSDF